VIIRSSGVWSIIDSGGAASPAPFAIAQGEESAGLRRAARTLAAGQPGHAGHAKASSPALTTLLGLELPWPAYRRGFGGSPRRRCNGPRRGDRGGRRGNWRLGGQGGSVAAADAPVLPRVAALEAATGQRTDVLL
jgi:hypothetical protein